VKPVCLCHDTNDLGIGEEVNVGGAIDLTSPLGGGLYLGFPRFVSTHGSIGGESQ